MAVRIRLRRLGRKKTPHYRVIVTDRTAPREGRFVESIGYYKPLNHPARLVIDLERVDYWIAQGAVPSDTVGSLIRKARIGGDHSLAVGEVSPEEEKARKAEALAARRKEEAEEAKAKAEEAEAARAAEAETAKAAEAEAAAAKAAEVEAEESAVAASADVETAEAPEVEEEAPAITEAEADAEPTKATADASGEDAGVNDAHEAAADGAGSEEEGDDA